MNGFQLTLNMFELAGTFVKTYNFNLYVTENIQFVGLNSIRIRLICFDFKVLALSMLITLIYTRDLEIGLMKCIVELNSHVINLLYFINFNPNWFRPMTLR